MSSRRAGGFVGARGGRRRPSINRYLSMRFPGEACAPACLPSCLLAVGCPPRPSSFSPLFSCPTLPPSSAAERISVLPSPTPKGGVPLPPSTSGQRRKHSPGCYACKCVNGVFLFPLSSFLFFLRLSIICWFCDLLTNDYLKGGEACEEAHTPFLCLRLSKRVGME